MTIYQEYCPLGRTVHTITFEITDGREPAPTTPCICGGTPEEQKLNNLVNQANLAAAQNELLSAFGENTVPQLPTYSQPQTHSSAFRIID